MKRKCLTVEEIKEETRIMINDLWFTNFLEKINNRTRIGTIQYKKPRAKDIVSAGPKMDDP